MAASVSFSMTQIVLLSQTTEEMPNWKLTQAAIFTPTALLLCKSIHSNCNCKVLAVALCTLLRQGKGVHVKLAVQGRFHLGISSAVNYSRTIYFKEKLEEAARMGLPFILEETGISPQASSQACDFLRKQWHGAGHHQTDAA